MTSPPSPATTDRDEVGERAEARRVFCSVPGTGVGGDVAVLRIAVPGGAGEGALGHVGWTNRSFGSDQDDPALPSRQGRSGGGDSTACELVRR